MNDIYTFVLYSFDLLGNSLSCFIDLVSLASFDSLFHSPPRANYNSVCSPRSFIHLLRQVKTRIKKAVNYIGKVIYWKCFCSWLLNGALEHKFNISLWQDVINCVCDHQRSTELKRQRCETHKITLYSPRFLIKTSPTWWTLPEILYLTLHLTWQANE